MKHQYVLYIFADTYVTIDCVLLGSFNVSCYRSQKQPWETGLRMD